MPRHAIRTLVILAGLSVPAAVLAQSAPPPCPFTPEVLAKHLGGSYSPGKPEDAILGKGCVYEGKGTKLWIEAGIPAAPSVAMMRKMMKPAGTVWTPVPKDPDGAVIETQKADVPSFPSISYERKGYLVNVFMTPQLPQDKPARDKAVADWNAKLVALPRIP